MPPSNFVPTVNEGCTIYNSKCTCFMYYWSPSLYAVTPPSLYALLLDAAVWQDRDERANLLQRHDTELIKQDKRYTWV